jgi:hypothetical protein
MPDGSYKTPAMYERGQMPVSCTVTVKKIVSGFMCEFTATVLFNEFKSARNPMWNSMPFQMIAKVAESHAIRKGWAISGVHIEEELGTFEPISDKVKEEMSPQHNSWAAAAKAIATTPSRLKSFNERYYMTPENENLFADLIKAFQNDL